jgi:DNA polymerase V
MKSSQRFALVDANHFYCSCERVFAPGLEGRPVIVLSNNDGCIASLTPEAKALGIKRGMPLFQVRTLVEKHQVAVFSSNYSLYGDLSSRVVDTLREFSPKVEIYSIDECFLDLSDVKNRNLTEYGYYIRNIVRQNIGIPVSLGIGETKVLSKIAHHQAKRFALGVMDLEECDQEEVLASVAVEDVWGIGSRWGNRLREIGIDNALAMRQADKAMIRKYLGVVGVHIAWELSGYSCLPLEMVSAPRKSVIVSRSFGSPVASLRALKEAVATFTAKAAQKLRREKLATQYLTVSITTSRFKDEHYSNQASASLSVATNLTQELLVYALVLTEKLYQKGRSFSKAGVKLLDLSPENQVQLNLFDWREPRYANQLDALKGSRERVARLLRVVDEINAQQGRGTLRFGAEGLRQSWQTRADRRSPRFTTQWRELPIVKA